MRTTARGTVRAVACAALVAAVACGGPTEGPAEPASVRVQLLPYLSNAPLLLAIEEGFFDQEGLRVELVPMARSSGAVPLLVQGQLDVLPGLPHIAIFNAIARGAHVRLVAGKGFIEPGGCTHAAVVARAPRAGEEPIRGAAGLAAGTVSVMPGSIFAYFLDQALEAAGVASEVALVDYPLATEFEALSEGKIDGALIGEPQLSQVLGLGSLHVAIHADEVIPDLDTGYLAFGPSLLEERPEIAHRFLVAYLRGVERYLEGKSPRNLETLHGPTKLSIEQLEAACWPQIRADGSIREESLVEYQRWAVSQELLERPLPIDSVWDGSLVERAALELGARD